MTRALALAVVAAGCAAAGIVELAAAGVRSGRREAQRRRAGARLPAALAGLLRSIAAGLEDAARVEADARSATAQARFTAWLVALLPVGAAVLGELADPGYAATLLRAPLAPWLVGAAAACQLLACALINRIARVGESL